MRMLARLSTAVLLAMAPLAPMAAGTASAKAPEPTPAPLLTSVNAIPGRYIVTLDRNADPAALATKVGVKPHHTYTSAMRGFAATLNATQLQQARTAPGVLSVEEDAKVTVPQIPTGTPAAGARTPASTWGLDRIDQRNLPLDQSFTTFGSGAGVNAYILDTGIDYSHSEFGGRAVPGFDAIADGRNGADCQGHGTHVAGTVGGKTYGVARKVNLISVRVLGCNGSGDFSGIIAGLDWVARNARQPAVLNASLGGPRSLALNNAATALSDRGVLPVVAAGNDAKDACEYSPASAARVLTVAASNVFDDETAFSNYGPCVSLYAPGQAIDSARLGGGSVAMNGTSMSAPHVTGTAALYKAVHPTAIPAEVAQALEAASTKDVLRNISKNTTNKLLFTDGL
ncbi:MULTISPECIES: S8 family peptidase [unclassified Streptomyces]|uniref:S8 family peptidase n=1 Tax=unclassified Streptomyces TaxID=2593676 RepID=UPI002252FC41|nr:MULTISPECIES: S8 family peptidase [unclassified Streptomyces]MCX4526928.1 S8 family peptidase [Streptomyces sp. NBC_01551]MCX4542512.1 S8 family peptidase [Streptomyces sp. NBC_01565]